MKRKKNEQILRDFLDSWPDDVLIQNRYGVEYFNIPAAFDIETTSFYYGEEKRACMYVWQFGLNFLPVLGRTWEEFLDFTEFLAAELGLHYKRRLVIYVHNLSFEFQFLRKWFEWKKVFAMKSRKPIYAITTGGLEFRCSYYLSGLSLQKVGENLRWHDVRKMAGDLDYNLCRNYHTPLTKTEIGYCINDVLVLNAYIEEVLKDDGDITRIPTTKTGYVRRGFRNACYHNEERRAGHRNYYQMRFFEFIKGLTLEPEEYQQLKRGFQGGFTHSNPYITGQTLENVTSFDITSSYPTVMVAEKFPMGRSEKIADSELTRALFENSIDKYCCLFDIEMLEVESSFLFDYYLSSSKCWILENPVLSNGRVVSADRICTTITEQDYYIMRQCYRWRSFRSFNFRRYRRGYLPKDFVAYLLKLYGDKTSLKGIAEKEAEYTKSKNQINSAYGMCVTDIVRDSYIYKDDQWQDPKSPELESAIEKYNKDKTRFLFYPWGVWVTAYARANLWRAILACGPDYCYSDTDSVKIQHADRHKKFFKQYNKVISEKLKAACDFQKLDFALTRPVTIKGVQKPLGVYDFDGRYRYFKTLGAKRYLVEYDDGHRMLTVAGLGKKDALEYMEKLSERLEKSIFDIFKNDMEIPKGYTGGSTLTYVDDPYTCPLTDYRGKTVLVSEKSCVHMEPDSYKMSIAQAFLNYIQFLKDGGTFDE